MAGLKVTAGETVNGITALRPLKDRLWRWAVRCHCGKEFSVVFASIRNGHTKSCGCLTASLKSKAQTLPVGMSVFKVAFKAHKAGAETRGLHSELTFEQYCQLVKQPCYFCGAHSVRHNYNKTKSYCINSVDRLNNEPFYKAENSVPSCFDCQIAKSDMLESQFEDYIGRVSRYLKIKGRL